MNNEDYESRSSVMFRTTSLRIPALLGLLLLSAGYGRLFAQQERVNSRHMKAYRLNSPPNVDGRVDSDWMSFEPAKNFIQQLPAEGEPASEPTEVRVGYTKDTLYIAVIC